VTILIAEDNLSLSKSISRCLRLRGYQTKAVASAAETHAAVRTQSFDALCLDLQLPGGSGLEILETSLTWKCPRTPVILMSGTGTEVDRKRGELAGARAFLTKPFALTELVGVLETALASKEANAKTRTPKKACGG
jgi:DNA-binding response OmpR family regulator